MLENPSTDLPAAGSNLANIKRYAPPNQRNRLLGRRKSGDRLDRANSYGTVGDRNHNKSSFVTSDPLQGLIPLQGCGNSEAFQLLSNRWTAATTAHDSLPEDSLEKPVLYSKKVVSAWGQAILPHLLIHSTSPVGASSSGLRRDFLSELQQAIHNANTGSNP